MSAPIHAYTCSAFHATSGRDCDCHVAELAALRAENARLHKANCVLQSQVDNADVNLVQVRLVWKDKFNAAQAENARQAAELGALDATIITTRAAIAAKDAALSAASIAMDRAWKLFKVAGFIGDGTITGPYIAAVEKVRAALSPDTGTGWLPPEETKKLRQHFTGQINTLYGELAASKREAEKMRAELAASRQANDHLAKLRIQDVDQLAAANEKLTAELAELREDKARVDWLDDCNVGAFVAKYSDGLLDVRAAISAARAGKEGAKCKRCEGTGSYQPSREPCATEEIICPFCKGSGNAGGAA